MHIILDLDETLLHSISMTEFIKLDLEVLSGLNKFHKRTLFLTGEGIPVDEMFMVILRPHLFTFIDWCFRNAESVSVWSAGTKEYVQEIVDCVFSINQKKELKFVWSRKQTCEFHRLHYKPLSKVYNKFPEMNASNTFLIDDKAQLHSRMNSTMNIIPIAPFIPQLSPNRYSHDMALLDRMSLLHNCL